MPKSIPLSVTLVLSLSLGMPGLARADEITDQLASARAQYDSGELRKAVQTLQHVTARIQEQIERNLLQLLPEPRQGWQADAAQSQTPGMAALIAGTNLSRRYYRNDGAEVEVGIMADSPLLPMMTMMLSNPLLMQMNPDIRIYSREGYQGAIEHEEGGDVWQISLLLADRILVKVEGSGPDGKEIAEDYLEAIDLEAVRRAFGV